MPDNCQDHAVSSENCVACLQNRVIELERRLTEVTFSMAQERRRNNEEVSGLESRLNVNYQRIEDLRKLVGCLEALRGHGL